jgi:glutathione S-transferase
MLTLYGFQFSNYVAMVQLALLEKGVPFRHVEVFPERSDAFLERSPLGKVPYVETDDGFLSETGVILDYLEEAYPEVPLLPPVPFERAQVRRLIKQLELYVELPARRCFPQALFGDAMDDTVRDRARYDLLAGVAALQRCGVFAPFLAGEHFTLADIVFLYSIQPAQLVARRVHQLDLLAGFDRASELIALLNERPHVRTIAAKRDKARPDYMAWMERQG